MEIKRVFHTNSLSSIHALSPIFQWKMDLILIPSAHFCFQARILFSFISLEAEVGSGRECEWGYVLDFNSNWNRTTRKNSTHSVRDGECGIKSRVLSSGAHWILIQCPIDSNQSEREFLHLFFMVVWHVFNLISIKNDHTTIKKKTWKKTLWLRF